MHMLLAAICCPRIANSTLPQYCLLTDPLSHIAALLTVPYYRLARHAPDSRGWVPAAAGYLFPFIVHKPLAHSRTPSHILPTSSVRLAYHSQLRRSIGSSLHLAYIPLVVLFRPVSPLLPLSLGCI
ncbi:hypothetical protein BV20DRAFT_829453 [Pilatotrama ljubarskyi]|nr:hypothetical protein BV20DRAFT_829453 [Pilatotrama ljubarskyi]